MRRYLQCCTLLIVSFWQEILGANTQKSLDQYNIYMNITKNYNKNIRPTDLFEIYIKMALKQVVSIDEKNQIMTSNSYVGMTWEDSRLSWNPADFNNVYNILMPTSMLWTIDLFIINTANTNGYVAMPSQSLASVSSDGIVYLVFSMTSLKTRCKINIKYYPFDTQTCSVIIE